MKAKQNPGYAVVHHGMVRGLLLEVGENPEREGLKETPSRFLSAWKNEWMCGYSMNPAEVLKTFEDGAGKYDEIVLVQNIPLYSHCEHHLAPFWGRMHVAYLPHKKIVGLSKVPRLVEVFARRLQVQERLTTEMAHALQDYLQPRGVAVVAHCRHMCMESRGIRIPGTITSTSAMIGEFRANPALRMELLAMLPKETQV